ncbi:uncharacterized protein cplane1 [Narcine bancroftii]|uniref:uncharacterized protein cplane1 n=1 Tax=Narcine bancroftii TaxID=1343680 RepID=UPI003831C59F
MKLKLEVLLSASINHKIPWPRLHWIGQEKEAILLYDDQRLSLLTLSTGRTQKKIPKLQPLLKNVLSVVTSANGIWLAGILTTGELFLWKKDGDCLKMVGAVEGVCMLAAAAQESTLELFLFVTNNGKRVLLLSQTGTAFLWQSSEQQDLPSVPGPRISGRWAQILPDERIRLPQSEDKESAVHAVFIADEMLGNCCLCSFAFISRDAVVLTTLEVKWFEQVDCCISAVPFSVQWTTQTHVLGGLIPACQPVKSRGALLIAFSPDGLVLAVIINQNDPKATQVLFVNPRNPVTVSSSLQGCGSRECPVPVRFIRSYWVGGVSWTQDGLFLACVLRRGALLLLSRLGELVTITTSGCCVEFGPAEFIPLHPLISYRQPLDADPMQSAGSSTGESDPTRQRFSLATHPRSPYLIVSDGYMFTVLRFAEHISATSALKSLLLEATQGLEDVQNLLFSSEEAELKWRVPHMTSLRRNILQGWGTQEPGTWTPPAFLTDQKSEGNEADEGDEWEGEPAGSASCLGADSMLDQGCLEFASAVDTLHAKQGEQANSVEAQFRRIQNSLLMSWSMGISLKEMDGRDLLLQHTVKALLQYARLLPFAPATLASSLAKLKGKMVHKALRRCPGLYRTLQLLRYCLLVLHWDAAHKHALTHVVSLVSGFVNLILSRKLGAASISQSLLSSLLVLRLSSVHLNAVYSLQKEAYPDLPRNLAFASFQAPVTQPADPGVKYHKLALLELPTQTVPTVQEPSQRLAFIWRLLYQQVLQHHSHLRKLQRHSGRGGTRKKLQREVDLLTSVLSQTQAALQAMGERLGERRQLKPLLGEEYFLLGSYLESVQTWKTALQGEVGGEERRLIYLQTRYCLAILYTHLYLSNLSAALDFCEQLVRQMFRPEQTNNSPGPSVLSLDVSLMPSVGEVAAVAVVQSLARFMALYFTNQPLFVLPPHHVDVLPPLHFRPGSLPRVVPLQQSRVAAAVREQNLCTGWSVERALDLMLLGRLIPEAAWMARTLGDWKTAVVLGLAFNLYSEGVPQAARSRWRSLHLPKELHPSQIFQEKLQALLGHAPMSDMPLPGCAVNSTAAPGHNRKLLTDSIEEEDADLMFDSVQEILKAAVMADADVLTQTFDLLMQSAKDLAMGLSGLVPEGLYLPAPPLYCPQPALISEGGGEDLGLSRERGARQKLSGLLQRFLLLFRAARCSLPAAHWYIRKLQHSRKIMNKIRRKSGMEPLCPFPNSLLQYSKAESSFFPPGARGDGTHGAISAKLVGSFRDLCGLCWMFHVREQLSERCRKYQAARESARSPQDCELAAKYDATVVDHCLASLEWACRMLPFARFMNVEELVQDVILSLVNELPPIRKVAEVVVRAFPDLEDVRVPLRDKHHSLQQRLRHSAMQGPDGEEMMTIVLHEVYRHRMKMLKRAGRNIGPTERHIWERADEGLREQEDEVHDQFSLGTSGSRSTLTDTRRSQDQSEGDTMDNMSMEIQELNEQQSCPQQQADISYREIQPSHHRTSRPQGPVCRKAAAESVAGEVEGHLPQLPLVGSWEFEREDEEYVNFLELFLSYLLERDQMVNESPSVPLLTSCSSFLREQELNSLAFHVQSTLKRRQSRVRVAEDTFLAKSTVTSVPDLHQHETSRMSPREEQMRAAIFSPIPATLHSPSHSHVPSAEGNVYGCFPAGIQHRDRARGLFGLKLQSLIGPSSTPWQLGPLPSSRPVIAPAPCTECLSVPALLNDDLAPEVEARFQGTAKLLEWMIRWSERRLRCGQHKVESLEARGATIRVKTSVTAILRSLELLGRSLGINMSHPNNKDDEEGFAVDHGRTRKSSDSSFFKASVAGSETHPEPFQQWDQEEDVQKQDRGDAQELTSDSDSGTDEDESGNSQRLHPQEDGGGIAPSGVYMEEETRPCTPISPSISISIKPKPRARIRVTMASGLETDAPISMDPGEQAGTAICRDPGECISKNSAKQSNEPTSTDHSETMDKSTDTDHREWMDKPTGTDRREMMDKPTGTDRREWMDKPTSTDRREMMDKPTSTDRREMMDKPTDRREWMDKPTGTDRREWMDKPTGTDRREWMDKPTSTDRREMVDKPTGTDRREWMDKPTGTDRREMVDKPTGTDQREWMDKPTGTDRREMVDKPTGTDRREWMDKPTGTDCSETMDKHVQVDSAQRQNIQQSARCCPDSKEGDWFLGVNFDLPRKELQSKVRQKSHSERERERERDEEDARERQVIKTCDLGIVGKGVEGMGLEMKDSLETRMVLREEVWVLVEHLLQSQGQVLRGRWRQRDRGKGGVARVGPSEFGVGVEVGSKVDEANKFIMGGQNRWGLGNNKVGGCTREVIGSEESEMVRDTVFWWGPAGRVSERRCLRVVWLQSVRQTTTVPPLSGFDSEVRIGVERVEGQAFRGGEIGMSEGSSEVNMVDVMAARVRASPGSQHLNIHQYFQCFHHLCPSNRTGSQEGHPVKKPDCKGGDSLPLHRETYLYECAVAASKVPTVIPLGKDHRQRPISLLSPTHSPLSLYDPLMAGVAGGSCQGGGSSGQERSVGPIRSGVASGGQQGGDHQGAASEAVTEQFQLRGGLWLQQINYLSLVQVVGSSLRDTLAPPTPTPSRNAPPAGHIASLGQQEDKRAPVENGLLQQKPSLSEEKVAKSPEDHPVHVGPEDAGVCGPWRLSKTSIVPQPQLLRGSGTSRQEVPGTCPTPGLPLLRLQPQRELQAVPVGGSKLPYPAPLLRPRVREAWAPQLTDRPRPSFPTYPNTPAPYQVTEDRDGWLSRGSPTLLKMVQYQQLPTPCSSQPPGKAAGSQPPALHGNPPPLVGLPLLRLPQPTQTTLLPLYSRPPPAEPRKLPAASTHYPNLQRQLTSFCPESQVSMFHPPRLIPAHDLVAFEQGRLRRAQQSPGRPQAEAFHLLKVNLQPFEPRTQHNGKKRVKRRERRRAEKSVCKVPSSEQSLKTPDQPVPQPVPQPEGRTVGMAAQAVEGSSSRMWVVREADSVHDGFVCKMCIQLQLLTSRVQKLEPELDELRIVQEHLPEDVSVTPKPDPWDGGTALAGSTLLPEWDSGSCLFATAAELHYLASTRKHTEERRDASTNTDQSTEPQPPTAPKSYRDAGILACSEIEDGDHPPTSTAAAPKSYRDAGILACSEIEDEDHPPTSAAAGLTSCALFWLVIFRAGPFCRLPFSLSSERIEQNVRFRLRRSLKRPCAKLLSGELVLRCLGPPLSLCSANTKRAHCIVTAVEPPPVDDPQVQVLPPDVLVNLRFPTEVYQESLSTPANPEAPDQELSGHEFLNVVDIDASDVLNDLPATTAVMDKMPTLKDEAMSIPALHLMSASLTNIVPPDTSPPHESPAAASVRFSCEDWGQQLAGDELTQRLLQKASAPVQAPPQEPVHANHQVRAQLSEMEQQLNALQDIAVNMEQDFANTKLLINTIEHLGCAIDLQGPGGCFVSLPVPGHAQPCDRADEKAMDRVYHAGEGSDPPSPPPVPSEKAAEGGWGPQVTAGWCECLGSGSPSPAHGTAKTRGSPRVLAAAAIPVSGRGVSSCPLMPQPGRSQEEPKQSHHQNLQIGAAPRRLQHHTPTRAPAEDLILPAAPIRMSRRKDSSSSLEDWLGWSGLSGVSDIISDLITEGKLSAEALGLTEGQARHLSRGCIESILSNCITIRFGSWTSSERKTLQRTVKSAEKFIWGSSYHEGRLQRSMQIQGEGEVTERALMHLDDEILVVSSKLPKKSEQKRKEVQEWMKCKRQQRLEAYLGHREELKERERRPYLPKDKRKAFTSREIKENQKKKAMRKRVTLAEHHEQRAQAALTLMSEMLCDTVQLPTSVVRARGDKPVKSAQHRRSGSGSTPRGRSPASRSLSAGRASWSLSDTFTMGGARSSPPSPGKAVQLVCQPLHTAADDLDDTDSLSRWSPPELIRHILARDTEPLLQEADVEDPHPGARADQDVQSDTIDDVLCELDWNSVNCMVASRNQK